MQACALQFGISVVPAGAADVLSIGHLPEQQIGPDSGFFRPPFWSSGGMTYITSMNPLLFLPGFMRRSRQFCECYWGEKGQQVNG